MMAGEFETARLTLRRFTGDDLDALVALDADPEVMRYLTGGAATPREVVAREVLPTFIRESAASDGFGFWAAIERAGGDSVGWFSFRPPHDGDPDAAALGYRLRRAAWGRGFATEGARTLIDRGFAEYGVRRVVASTYEDNAASRRVMERAGPTFARAFRLTAADLAAQDTATGPPTTSGTATRWSTR